MSKFSHFVLTRFNIKGIGDGNAPDIDWLHHRFNLFDIFCYPSLKSQTNQKFKWIVCFHPETPKVFKDKIATYAKWDNFIPCYVSSLDRLAEKAKATILNHINPNVKYLITTRLDNDDAVSIDFIENIQNEFSYQDFEFINFTNGFLLDVITNKLYFAKHHSNPFISLIEKIDNFKTVWCGSHGRLSSIGRVRQINTKPQWIRVVHGRNVYKEKLSYFKRAPIKLLDKRFELHYLYNKDKENIILLHVENAFRVVKVLRRKISSIIHW